MKLALVGVGGAGSRIVNQIAAYEDETNRNFTDGNILAFNTTGFEFDVQVVIPADHQYVIGDTHRVVEGEGVNGDIELAVDVTTEELADIKRTFDRLEVFNLDGVLLAAGLGGGTGGGAGSVLLRELRSMYEKPIYSIGVLPHPDAGGLRALNAARALQSFVEYSDNVLLFDNNAWHGGDREDLGEAHGDVDGEFAETNQKLAERMVPLLAAGEYNSDEIGENVLDSSDLIRTLATGGVSSVGHASMQVTDGAGRIRRVLRRMFRLNNGRKSVEATHIDRLVKQAVKSTLTVPCNITSTQRALIVLSGPDWALSRRGFENSRLWLEEATETVEILAGDEPLRQADQITVSVLLSTVTDVPRISEIQEQAREYLDDHATRSEAGGFTFDTAP